jgi:hypothetical protein
MSAKETELAELVRQKIEHLRPRLLDLSRRNPLLSTKLGPRSNSHIRAVDELPDIVFFKLNNGQEMRLVPLPAIDDEPRDEMTRVFREALINARLTDEKYIAEMESVDRDADDYLDHTRQIERALKDRVRAALGMPERTRKNEVNLVQHAKINGITPSYELPSPDEEHEDGRHTDDNIQTLLLPADLERKLNAIMSKCRTWIQETGMNVLHVAYGFLEWSDKVQTETSFAPLILCEAEIEKRRTVEGAQFFISGIGDGPAINAVLAEKLRLEFGVELPPFSGSSAEEYLAEVGKLSPRNMTWRVRRQVAIGVFPSARMAMYHDLDPSQADLSRNEIVRSLLAGGNPSSSSPFADEYSVDQPEIERKVPFLVMDADSSQFSTLVDIAEGRNLAVEGPPGTGKSQTIVNAIAAALAEGKKVLFVAEKLAALNVVKSRLEAAELGEFLLPLQADKSTREQVIKSVRDRLEMRSRTAVRDFDEKLKEYRHVRQQIEKYIALMGRAFRDTGLTVHDILGKSIATNGLLSGFAPESLERCKVPESFLTVSGLALLRQIGMRIEVASREVATAQPHWQSTRLLHPERFTIEEACDLAARAADALSELAEARDQLPHVRLSKVAPSVDLSVIDEHLKHAQEHLEQHASDVLLALLSEEKARIAHIFLGRCEAVQRQWSELGRVLSIQPGPVCVELLGKVASLCESLSLSTANPATLEEDLKGRREVLETARAISAALESLVACVPESRSWSLSDLSKAYALIREAGPDALVSRNGRTGGSDVAYVLRRLCVEGRKLQDEKVELARTLSFAIDAPTEVLMDCVSTLRTAGIFRALSPRFRRAKKLYLSLSLTGKYRKFEALSAIDALIGFRKREAGFRNNPHAFMLFGLNFKGIETEFASLERLVAYYQAVDSQFGHPDRTSLRAFLRGAELSELELIPGLPLTELAITYDMLQSRITAAEAEIQALQEAIVSLKSCVHILSDPATVDPSELRPLIDRVRGLIREESELDRMDDLRTIIGGSFNGARTQVHKVKDVVRWGQEVRASGQALIRVLSADKGAEARSRIADVLRAERGAMQLIDRLTSTAKVEGRDFTEGRSLEDAAKRLRDASVDADGLFHHAVFATALEEVRPQGLLPLIEERLKRGGLLNGLADQFEALAARQMAKAVYAEVGSELTKYRGATLDELRTALAKQDKEIIELSRRQLRAKVCASARPPSGNGIGRKSSWTEMALIENEISKKQRFISVRELTQRAGRALLELKPCWMMSPLAVAQYVPKNSMHFDLCIIDEASQMPPESAIGALLRCTKTVVVGDTNQLPPSSFFKTMVDDEGADEDETVLNESVLEMANATFRPARRLRWHYRSRHSGLIKFSNRLVYEDNLVVFPSATESISRMGIEFRAVSGRYKAGTNPVEAKTIVEAALEFMRTDPNRSLGVVTLNQKQMELIREEFEYVVGSNRHALDYIESWKNRNDGLEEFFIKNLENVQGDERDVIFIGTVYGSEVPGAPVMQRFGPINGLAGKRRLNVLFTRAKQKIVTFSSMTAADIVAEEDGNPGAYMLKRWLEYSASGVLDGGERTEREPDSDFERFVIKQIKGMGCEPIPQVGVAGYFVDIGVRHPDWPHGFLLGVECDGASYHSAKSARDRDRLRQEVLERLGWRLHRIWSTDWFNNPQREAQKLREVIATRLAELKGREFEYTPPPASKIASPKSEAVVLPLFKEERAPEQPAKTALAQAAAQETRGVAIGDTVRVRYLTDDKKTLRITISRSKSDPLQGVINCDTPIAKALLGAEEGDEVEVLVGSYVKLAIVESVVKGTKGAAATI